MAAAILLVAFRLMASFQVLPHRDRILGLALLALATAALLLGRQALAWREGRSRRSAFPRIHRAAGSLTLGLLALAAVAWLLRRAF